MVQVVKYSQPTRRAAGEDDVSGLVHVQGGGEVGDQRIEIVPAPQPEIARLALPADGDRVRSPAAEAGAIAVL